MANLVVNNKNYTKTGNINVGQFSTEFIPFITTDRDIGDQSVTLPLYGDEVSQIEVEFSPRATNDGGYIYYCADSFYLWVGEASSCYFDTKSVEIVPTYLNENIKRFRVDFENSQITDMIRDISYTIRYNGDFGFTHNPIQLFKTTDAAVGEIKFYDLNKDLAIHLVPRKNFETGLSYYLDLVSGIEYYPNIPWNYCEYSEESILYTWNKPKPIFSETKISSVNGTNVELSEDYHNFDFIKIKLSNTNYSDVYSDILCTPSSLDKMLTASNANRVCITYGGGSSNQYILLYKTDNTHLTFASARGGQFYEMYGVKCSNYDIDITDIYTATTPSGAYVEVPLEGIDLSDFDYLILGGNSGSSDEQVPGWYLTDVKAAIYEGRYEFLLHYGYVENILIRPNSITSARYGVIEGIKLLPKTNT